MTDVHLASQLAQCASLHISAASGNSATDAELAALQSSASDHAALAAALKQCFGNAADAAQALSAFQAAALRACVLAFAAVSQRSNGSAAHMSPVDAFLAAHGQAVQQTLAQHLKPHLTSTSSQAVAEGQCEFLLQRCPSFDGAAVANTKAPCAVAPVVLQQSNKSAGTSPGAATGHSRCLAATSKAGLTALVRSSVDVPCECLQRHGQPVAEASGWDAWDSPPPPHSPDASANQHAQAFADAPVATQQQPRVPTGIAPGWNAGAWSDEDDAGWETAPAPAKPAALAQAHKPPAEAQSPSVAAASAAKPPAEPTPRYAVAADASTAQETGLHTSDHAYAAQSAGTAGVSTGGAEPPKKRKVVKKVVKKVVRRVPKQSAVGSAATSATDNVAPSVASSAQDVVPQPPSQNLDNVAVPAQSPGSAAASASPDAAADNDATMHMSPTPTWLGGESSQPPAVGAASPSAAQQGAAAAAPAAAHEQAVPDAGEAAGAQNAKDTAAHGAGQHTAELDAEGAAVGSPLAAEVTLAPARAPDSMPAHSSVERGAQAAPAQPNAAEQVSDVAASQLVSDVDHDAAWGDDWDDGPASAAEHVVQAADGAEQASHASTAKAASGAAADLPHTAVSTSATTAAEASHYSADAPAPPSHAPSDAMPGRQVVQSASGSRTDAQPGHGDEGRTGSFAGSWYSDWVDAPVAAGAHGPTDAKLTPPDSNKLLHGEENAGASTAHAQASYTDGRGAAHSIDAAAPNAADAWEADWSDAAPQRFAGAAAALQDASGTQHSPQQAHATPTPAAADASFAGSWDSDWDDAPLPNTAETHNVQHAAGVDALAGALTGAEDGPLEPNATAEHGEAENVDSWNDDGSDDWSDAPLSRPAQAASSMESTEGKAEVAVSEEEARSRCIIRAAQRAVGSHARTPLVQAIAQSALQGEPLAVKLAHYGGAVQNILSSGLGALGLRSSTPQLSEYDTVVIIVLGGLTVGEVADVEALQRESQAARALGADVPEVLVGGIELFQADAHVADMVAAL